MFKSRKPQPEPSQAYRMLMAENKICSVVGQKLQEQYPGYHWLVECVWQTGTVTVKNLNLNGDYGFVLHLEAIVNDNDLNLVTIAGGELLERCGLPRGARPDGDELNNLDRDGRGNVTDKAMDMTVAGGEF